MDLFNLWTVFTVAVVGYYFVEYKKVAHSVNKVEEARIAELEKRIAELELHQKNDLLDKKPL